MTLMHELSPVKGRIRKRRVGRGGKRGTYSGRGQKGQRARAGRNIRPQEREELSKIPQKRGTGFDRRSRNRGRMLVAVNLTAINTAYTEGEIVSPKTLLAKQLIVRRFSRVPIVKVLGSGELSKRLTFKGCSVSDPARKKIVDAGGTC